MTFYDALIAAREAAIEKHSPQASGLAVAVNLYRCWEMAGAPQVDDYVTMNKALAFIVRDEPQVDDYVIDNDLMFLSCPRCER